MSHPHPSWCDLARCHVDATTAVHASTPIVVAASGAEFRVHLTACDELGLPGGLRAGSTEVVVDVDGVFENEQVRVAVAVVEVRALQAALSLAVGRADLETRQPTAAVHTDRRAA